MRRVATDLTVYNRNIAMRHVDEGPGLPKNVLTGLAANEMTMIYLLVRWAGCTDVGYVMKGVKKTGHAFDLPSRKQVDFALKWMR